MDAAPSERERIQSSREALAEAALEVVRNQPTEPARPPRPPASSRRAVLAIIAGWLFLIWIWSTRPAWIFGEQPPRLSAAQQQAEARYALFLMRQRVEEYRIANGALPSALSDLDRVEDGIRFRPETNGYALVASVGTDSFVLTSRMNADSFLGNALRVLQSAR
jgi:hypothetical protein